MKKSRYSESQIVSILKEAENGVPVSDLCRTHGRITAGHARRVLQGSFLIADIRWNSGDDADYWRSQL